jgi:acyl-CoA thioester hydrolase
MQASPAAPWAFSIDFEVRDYELDLQGIVNNANYFHYFEHARHAFIRSRGVDFAALHEEGQDPVVYRAEIDYREPLKSGERFTVLLRLRREGRLKLVFEEAIVKEGGREAARAVFETAFISIARGRPVPPPPSALLALFPGEGGKGEEA